MSDEDEALKDPHDSGKGVKTTYEEDWRQPSLAHEGIQSERAKQRLTEMAQELRALTLSDDIPHPEHFDDALLEAADKLDSAAALL